MKASTLTTDLRREVRKRTYNGEWHRHTADAPDAHDTSDEGRRPITLSEFLDEAEAVISALELL